MKLEITQKLLGQSVTIKLDHCKGINRCIQPSALNKIIGKFKIKNITANKGYKFSELSVGDKMFAIIYITWFSINKGIMLGKVIGQSMDKELIPPCYAKAIRKIIERIE